MGKNFQAMVVEETDDGFVRSLQQRSTDDLPDGELLVRVSYSSLNYKDALSATGNKGVTRNYPHTPGIDASGTVEEDSSGKFQAGDEVIVTSYDLGMNTDGGFAEYIRVPVDWAVPQPAGLTLEESMIYGTAGFTAGMSVDALIETVSPEDGEILVTGATGGVGSIAVAILAKLGYEVVALSGKSEAEGFLKSLGCKETISREAFLEGSDRPMLRTRWAGVIDAVGGDILATAIKSTNPLGAVTCCGNAASPDLPLNVFPFILRGVRLIGIDSQNCPMEKRTEVWNKLAGEWRLDVLHEVKKSISVHELDENIDLILKGGQKGRVVVSL